MTTLNEFSDFVYQWVPFNCLVPYLAKLSKYQVWSFIFSCKTWPNLNPSHTSLCQQWNHVFSNDLIVLIFVDPCVYSIYKQIQVMHGGIPNYHQTNFEKTKIASTKIDHKEAITRVFQWNCHMTTFYFPCHYRFKSNSWGIQNIALKIYILDFVCFFVNMELFIVFFVLFLQPFFYLFF